MHPHLLGAFAAERRAQMMANAETIRLARQAGGEHRRGRIKSVPGRWHRLFAVRRIRALHAAQIRHQRARPAGQATGTAPTT